MVITEISALNKQLITQPGDELPAPHSVHTALREALTLLLQTRF